VFSSLLAFKGWDIFFMLGPLGLFNLELINLKAIFLPFYLGVPCRIFVDANNQRNTRKKSADYGG
jgi:hypothetical protein